MSETKGTQRRRGLRAFFWLAGIGVLVGGAWFAWFRVTESRLIGELEAVLAEWDEDPAWTHIAEELIEHGSRRSVRTILSCALRTEPEFEYDAYVDRLCDTFGSSYVWGELFEAADRVLSIKLDGAFPPDRFWIQNPESRELAKFAERLATSGNAQKEELAALLIPLATSMPKDRKIDLLLQLSRESSRANTALFSLSIVGVGSRERDLLATFSDVSSGDREIHRIVLSQTDDGFFRLLLRDGEIAKAEGSTYRLEDPPNAEIVERWLGRDGWLEKEVLSGRDHTDVVCDLVRRGRLRSERLFELLDAVGKRAAAGYLPAALAVVRTEKEKARDQLIERLNDSRFAGPLSKMRGIDTERAIALAWKGKRSTAWRRGALLALGWLRSSSPSVGCAPPRPRPARSSEGRSIRTASWKRQRTLLCGAR